MSLSKKTRLQVSPSVTLKLISINNVELEYEGKSVVGSDYTLSILHSFYKEKTYEEGLLELGELSKSKKQ